MSAKRQILDRLATCGQGKVRNPESSRCVRTDRPLGKAIVALAAALESGAAVPNCNRGVHNPATGRCDASKPVVAALTTLTSLWRMASKANAGRGNAANANAGRALLAECAAELDRLKRELKVYKNMGRAGRSNVPEWTSLRSRYAKKK